MNKITKNTVSLIWGAIIGALITPAFMAVMALGTTFASLPFIPFDFFNWIARVLPGGVITFGIDAMVEVLILLGLGSDLDRAAKLAEQFMALGVFWLVGIVLGVAFFALFNALRHRPSQTTMGAMLGLLAGLPFILITLTINVSSAAPFELQVVWLVLSMVGFGAVLGWAYEQLQEQPTNSVEITGRRDFLVRVGGATAALTVVGSGLSALLSGNTDNVPGAVGSDAVALTDSSGSPLPNADDVVIPAPGTRLEYTPIAEHYRIDILASGLPAIPDNYQLEIAGLVANPVRWTLDEIRAMPAQDAYITMSCISNRLGGSLISTTKWTGVPMQHILDLVQPDATVGALKITGADGFDEFVDIELIRNDDRIMLAYAFDDAPLPLRNGYPLRIHIPDRYGMKQPKWITSIEFIPQWQEGYWVRRGWSRDAIVHATSVIDTVAVENVYTDAAGEIRVPVGGIAWAGDRGISRVEISVDSGEWQPAELRTPFSERSWVIWRYDWPFTEGSHEFAVRCYEAVEDAAGDAILQPTQTQGTRPDGATGVFTRTAFARAPRTETDA